MSIRFILTLLAITTIGGCAPIQHTQTLDASIKPGGTAGIGDIVARVNKQRNLQKRIRRV